MKIVVNYRFLAISTLALVLVAAYVFWAKPFSPPTSDLEAHLELVWKKEVNQSLAHVEFSPDGKVLAFRDDHGDKDKEGSIAFLDVGTLLPRGKKIPFTEGLRGWAFHFIGNGLLAAKSKKEVCFYDIDSGQIMKRIADPGRGIAAVSPDGNAMIFLDSTERTDKHELLIQEIDTGKRIGGPLGGDHGVSWGLPAVFSPCGRYVACHGGAEPGCPGGTWFIQVVDARTTQQLHVLKLEYPLDKRGTCFSPDSRYLAAVRNQDEIRVWNVSSGRLTSVRVDWRDAGYPKVIAFSPDGRLIASGGSDSTARESDPCWSFQRAGAIKLSDARTGALLFSLNLERRPGMPLSGVPRALAFSPDGKMLAVGLEDLPSGRVTLWKVEVREKAEE